MAKAQCSSQFASKKIKKTDQAAQIQKQVLQRVQSREFKTALSRAMESEIRDVSKMKIGDYLDAGAVRNLVKHSNSFLLSQNNFTGLIKTQVAALEDYFGKKNISISEILDSKTKQKMSALMTEKYVMSDNAKEFVGKIIRSEFITGLFVNVIHVTLVSFYKKVNPIFGGITTAILENKIKAFIEVMIKVILDQAVSFVVSPANQENLARFSHTVIELLLKEKVIHFFEEMTAERRKKIYALAESVAFSKKIQAQAQEIFLKVFDDFYLSVKNQKAGDFFKLKGQEKTLAGDVADLVIPCLKHKPVVDFLVQEITLLK